MYTDFPSISPNNLVTNCSFLSPFNTAFHHLLDVVPLRMHLQRDEKAEKRANNPVMCLKCQRNVDEVCCSQPRALVLAIYRADFKESFSCFCKVLLDEIEGGSPHLPQAMQQNRAVNIVKDISLLRAYGTSWWSLVCARVTLLRFWAES